jgi:two-component system, NarL family, sensor histidine kinase DesK
MSRLDPAFRHFRRAGRRRSLSGMRRWDVPLPMTRREGSRWRVAGPISGLWWLAFPFASLADADPPADHLVLAVTGVLVFVAIYMWTFVRPEEPLHDLRRDAVVIVVLAAIAVLLTVAERPDWAMLFVYVTVPAGVRLPLPLNFATVAVCALIAFAAGTVAGAEDDVALTWAATTFGLGLLFCALGRLVNANAQLRAARAELAERAVAEERLRFARDLHDLLGHSLSVIALKAELAGRLLPERPDAAREHVGDVERVAREALAEVREAVSGYRRPTLAGEVAGARVALEAAGIEAEVDVPSAPLPADAEAVLAWAVREGTTNVIRHSGARRASIIVAPGPADATAEVVDDGTGSAACGPAGSGLAGLRERAERLGGRLEAGARADGGFAVRVTVPVVS